MKIVHFLLENFRHKIESLTKLGTNAFFKNNFIQYNSFGIVKYKYTTRNNM